MTSRRLFLASLAALPCLARADGEPNLHVATNVYPWLRECATPVKY